MQKSLHDCFKSNSVLPSYTGSLSKVVVAMAISYANKEVMAVLKVARTKVKLKEGEPIRDILERKELELQTMQWHMDQLLCLIIPQWNFPI